MYILKNSLISIVRNKGRNILIGIIILVIAASSTVTLAIRNTASRLVKNYEESHDVIASISFDRKGMMENFKGGEDGQKENIEAFNQMESFTLEDVKNYAESPYLKGWYYVYATSVNSDNLTKATDSYEYEVESKETTKTTSSKTTGGNARPGPMPEGMGGGERHTTIQNNITTVITKSKEIFQSARNFTGDFELDGYSSYEAMTDFVEGKSQIIEGEMITNFSELECVVSSELATLNELSVGSTIQLKNPKDGEKVYEFIVTGIYKDNTDSEDTQKMYSSSANKIITGSGAVEKLLQEEENLTTNLTPSFILKDKEVIEAFTEEVKEKGLKEYYTISTNREEIENATKSIENVKTFATTFFMITLLISSVVLFVINMINIRERKYEIGVFRTIGMSKGKLSMQFVLELLIVSAVMLGIGAILGGYLAKPIGNSLLQSEIEESQMQEKEISENFGKGPMEMEFNRARQVEEITSMDAVVDIQVIAQLLGIGILLSLVSSLASMISIQRFSPLTILKERS